MTPRNRTPDDPHKSDRALALYEKGLTPTQIAERLGTNPRSTSAMILQAKKRREKLAGVTE